LRAILDVTSRADRGVALPAVRAVQLCTTRVVALRAIRVVALPADRVVQLCTTRVVALRAARAAVRRPIAAIA
jgi:hypothetical protein